MIYFIVILLATLPVRRLPEETPVKMMEFPPVQEMQFPMLPSQEQYTSNREGKQNAEAGGFNTDRRKLSTHQADTEH